MCQICFFIKFPLSLFKLRFIKKVLEFLLTTDEMQLKELIKHDNGSTDRSNLFCSIQYSRPNGPNSDLGQNRYNPIGWRDDGGYQSTMDSFLFKLSDNFGIVRISRVRNKHAVEWHSDCGLILDV